MARKEGEPLRTYLEAAYHRANASKKNVEEVVCNEKSGSMLIDGFCAYLFCCVFWEPINIILGHPNPEAHSLHKGYVSLKNWLKKDLL